MKCRLISGRSDAGICLLFGNSPEAPGAARESAFAQWLDQETARGTVFSCDLHATDGCAIDCYVDDDPPEDIDAYSLQTTEELLLKVPSGRLCFAAADAVAEDDTDAWDCMDVPAGDYAIRVWLVHPPHLLRTSRHRLKEYGIGIAILLAFIMFGVFGVNQITAFFATMAVGLTVFAAVVFMLLRRATGREEKQRRELEAQLRNGPPDLVARLTIAGEPRSLTGGGISV